jgi:hypothetical protein
MPVAVNCTLVSTAIVGFVGVIEMDSSWASLLVEDATRLAVPPPLPQPNKLVIISDVKRTKHAFFLTICVPPLFEQYIRACDSLWRLGGH